MAKKNIKPVNPVKPAPVAAPPVFNFPLRTKYIILAVIAFVFYGNTLLNQYALDDNGVILNNQYVLKGIKGIFDIMNNDAYASYLQQLHASQNFTGGRYRPLSIVAFAIEQSLFGDSAFIRHFINILFFIATVLAVYYFLANFLLKKIPRGEDSAFLAAILFAIHPLHTEVVANIKSFDEILSLFFILLTFICSLEYINRAKKKYLYAAVVSFFLSMLSKEYAFMLVVLLPLLFYLYPAETNSKKKLNVINASLPYFATAFVYMLLRIHVVGIPHSNPNVHFINNFLRTDPYYFAKPAQKFATEWYALGKYLFMLFIPYPLSCDYSYNQIPYHNFSDITVWLSILVYVAIIYWGIKLLRKKDIMAFPVFFFVLMLIPISNFFINVGAIFGERFDYHASFGFVIMVSYIVFRLTRKITFTVRKKAITGVLGVVMVVFAVETVARNADWKNDTTLFVHDIKVVPNSEFADCNAAVGYINMAMEKGNENRKVQMLDTAVLFCRRAIKMDPSFPDPFINAGLAYYYLSNLDSAKYYWDILQNGLYPNHPTVQNHLPFLALSFLNKARMEDPKQPFMAIRDIQKGISEDSVIPQLWYNLGGLYFSIHMYDSAQYAWNRTLRLNPDTQTYKATIGGLNSIPQKSN